MSVVVITGSGGLIGAEASLYFGGLGFTVVGIDNDMRRTFFGPEASTTWMINRLKLTLGRRYRHHSIDIRNRDEIVRLLRRYRSAISLVIHTAAQPSHDWAANDPLTDFDINATGTVNLLEAARQHAPQAVFIFTSTNKVYGDTPNSLPLVELPTRYEIEPGHRYAAGIREDMSIDHSQHSLFGSSKVAADVMVQEYGRYYGMQTVCFRGGTLSGPGHSATQLHGFLAYLLRCAMTGRDYTIFGYKGKQVRDAIHSSDLIQAFHEYFKSPRVGEVYNIGGGRPANVSVIEAIQLSEEITGNELNWSYSAEPRRGDHIWWISDNQKFRDHFPNWRPRHSIEDIMRAIFEENQERWTPWNTSQQPVPAQASLGYSLTP